MMLSSAIKRSGAITGAHGQQQHVDLFRKIILRRKLLSLAVDGAAYVPFIGDGDIAAEVYADRKVYGADLDTKRVKTARERLAGSVVIKANCDRWPFPECEATFAVADFDSYADPYASFRSWWANAQKSKRVVLFFTDGLRIALMRSTWLVRPSGGHVKIPDLFQRRLFFNGYFPKYIRPWFVDYIGAEWRVIKTMFYLRGMMIYWGAVIEQT